MKAEGSTFDSDHILVQSGCGVAAIKNCWQLMTINVCLYPSSVHSNVGVIMTIFDHWHQLYYVVGPYVQCLAH